jgi:hypothetical protein
MEDEVPPTDFCIRMKPWLALVSSMYLGLAVLRAPAERGKALFTLFVFWLGLQSSWKTLRMNILSLFFFATFFSVLMDTLQLFKDFHDLPRLLNSPDWKLVSSGVALTAAPIISNIAFFLSLQMLKDYGAAIESRAADEQRAFRAQVRNYGGFVPFQGTGRTLDSE